MKWVGAIGERNVIIHPPGASVTRGCLIAGHEINVWCGDPKIQTMTEGIATVTLPGKSLRIQKRPEMNRWFLPFQ